MAAMASRARKPHLVWLADRMRARDSQCLWNARPAAVKLTWSGAGRRHACQSLGKVAQHHSARWQRQGDGHKRHTQRLRGKGTHACTTTSNSSRRRDHTPAIDATGTAGESSTALGKRRTASVEAMLPNRDQPGTSTQLTCVCMQVLALGSAVTCVARRKLPRTVDTGGAKNAWLPAQRQPKKWGKTSQRKNCSSILANKLVTHSSCAAATVAAHANQEGWRYHGWHGQHFLACS